jgi:hypothetical protein
MIYPNLEPPNVTFRMNRDPSRRNHQAGPKLPMDLDKMRETAIRERITALRKQMALMRMLTG